MVRYGDSSKEELYEMLRSTDERRRHLAFDLLEASNSELKDDKATFLRVLRFIWDATVSYDVCRDFALRHAKMLIECSGSGCSRKPNGGRARNPSRQSTD